MAGVATTGHPSNQAHGDESNAAGASSGVLERVDVPRLTAAARELLLSIGEARLEPAVIILQIEASESDPRSFRLHAFGCAGSLARWAAEDASASCQSLGVLHGGVAPKRNHAYRSKWPRDNPGRLRSRALLGCSGSAV